MYRYAEERMLESLEIGHLFIEQSYSEVYKVIAKKPDGGVIVREVGHIKKGPHEKECECQVFFDSPGYRLDTWRVVEDASMQ